MQIVRHNMHIAIESVLPRTQHVPPAHAQRVYCSVPQRLATFLELYTDSVFSVGIRSVFLGNYHTDTEGKLGRYFRYTYIQKVRNLQ